MRCVHKCISKTCLIFAISGSGTWGMTHYQHRTAVSSNPPWPMTFRTYRGCCINHFARSFSLEVGSYLPYYYYPPIAAIAFAIIHRSSL